MTGTVLYMIVKIKKIKALSGRYPYCYKLIVDSEFFENLNMSKPICRNCNGIIDTNLPFYFCQITNNSICVDCETNKRGTPTCLIQENQEKLGIAEHKHFRIIKIEIIGED